MGFTSTYSCDGLASKLKLLLIASGARPDAKVQADMKDDAATKAIKEGLKDADGKAQMKPFDTLTDDEVKALVAYVRGLKG